MVGTSIKTSSHAQSFDVQLALVAIPFHATTRTDDVFCPFLRRGELRGLHPDGLGSRHLWVIAEALEWGRHNNLKY